MSKKRVLVGMSGGVDSSLAAALLLEQGYDVIGATLRLYDYAESLEEVDPDKKDCHPLAFIHDAQEVCRHLGIQHLVIDHRDTFDQVVVRPFKESYHEGKTPLPCIGCNKDVKTQRLFTLMQDLGADFLATGHYVRTIMGDRDQQWHQGADSTRDQSFFLFAIDKTHLQRMLFPLGHFSKDMTRAAAKERGLCVAKKSASQDLCFISKKSYHDFVGQDNPGDIVDEQGNVLGRHKGIAFYTVGQRQGLALGGHHDPLYVVRLDPKNNLVVVGPRTSLAVTSVTLTKVNWLADDLSLGDDLAVHVKMRSAGKMLPARLATQDGQVTVHLDQPDYGLSRGQACVFYHGTRLLGGGFIDTTLR